MLKQSGMLSAVGAATALSPIAAGAAALARADAKVPMLMKQGNFKDNLYTQIGLRPIINCRGTFTIISGSCSLMEVKQAMFDASFYYVHLNEMMDAVGAELAKLTGAEWGICTTGASAATCLATIACIAGTDIEKCEALPNIKKKDQVLIPKSSRNPYDIGVRMSGTELLEFETVEEMRSLISDRTAMLYILAGPLSTSGPLSTKILSAIAREKGIPVFVDAAAEEPNNPNIHLTAGADLVAYSGGKCMRGPQSAGLLLGNKNLCQAAYYQAAPHHCYGRALKCSKEERMGMLAAVRAWYKRDHVAEAAEWTRWMQYIADQLKGIPSLTATVTPPHEDLSNKCPGLRVTWDSSKVGITGAELAAKLDAGEPRIIMSARGARPDTQSSCNISSYMLEPGNYKIVAEVLRESLLHPGHYENPVVPSGTPASVSGEWAVSIQYLRGVGEQKFILKQNANAVTGDQHGEIFNATFTGSIHENEILLESVLPVHAWPVHCHFKGTVSGNTISGTALLGSGSNFSEYGSVTWSAIRA
jgi:seryl-tRNA(Sec) selenium transferase